MNTQYLPLGFVYSCFATPAYLSLALSFHTHRMRIPMFSLFLNCLKASSVYSDTPSPKFFFESGKHTDTLLCKWNAVVITEQRTVIP